MLIFIPTQWHAAENPSSACCDPVDKMLAVPNRPQKENTTLNSCDLITVSQAQTSEQKYSDLTAINTLRAGIRYVRTSSSA